MSYTESDAAADLYYGELQKQYEDSIDRVLKEYRLDKYEMTERGDDVGAALKKAVRLEILDSQNRMTAAARSAAERSADVATSVKRATWVIAGAAVLQVLLQACA